jgi:hypothetical protein
MPYAEHFSISSGSEILSIDWNIICRPPATPLCPHVFRLSLGQVPVWSHFTKTNLINLIIFHYSNLYHIFQAKFSKFYMVHLALVTFHTGDLKDISDRFGQFFKSEMIHINV